MTKEDVDLILSELDTYTSRFGYKSFSMNFFGGEPAIKFDLVTYILDCIKGDKRFARRMFTTNGLLLDQDKVDYLNSTGTLIAVSYDGLWNKHNRCLANGQSSFESYMERMDFFKQFGSSRAMLAPSSLPNLLENYVHFIEQWGFRFLDLALIKDSTWEPEYVTLFDTKLSQLTELILKYWNEGVPNLPSLYKNHMLMMLSSAKQGKPVKGCECCTWMMNFMPDGYSYGCGRFGYSKIKPIYNYRTKEWYEDNIDFFHRPDIMCPPFLKKCQDCEIYDFCPTGCMFDDLIKVGDDYERRPIDTVCELYKITCRESLRLFNALKNRKDFQQVFREMVFIKGGLR
jgi:radical SAM protein with 4Fe4S-binding SPASM domain